MVLKLEFVFHVCFACARCDPPFTPRHDVSVMWSDLVIVCLRFIKTSVLLHINWPCRLHLPRSVLADTFPSSSIFPITLIWSSYPSRTFPQLLCAPTIAVAPFPQQPMPEALTCPAAVPAPATSPSALPPHLPQLVLPLMTPVPTIHVATVPSPTEHPCLPADTPAQVPGTDRTGPKRISADSFCLLYRAKLLYWYVMLIFISVCLGSIAA